MNRWALLRLVHLLHPPPEGFSHRGCCSAASGRKTFLTTHCHRWYMACSGFSRKTCCMKEGRKTGFCRDVPRWCSGTISPWIFFLHTLEVSLEADAQRSLSVASGPLRDSLPMFILKWAHWTSLVVQWLRLCPSKAGSVDLIPGQGTKTPQSV